MKTQIVSEERRGAILYRVEIWEMEGFPATHMNVAYNLDGDYIGDWAWADKFAGEGIYPERTDPSHAVCSVGFSSSKGKWYGWSHRACHSFTVGDRVDSADHLCATTGYIDGYLESLPPEEREQKDKRLPVGFEAKTLADARRMAVAYAESVS